LLWADGRVVGQSLAAYMPDMPRDGWVEQCPTVWWNGAKAAIRALLADFPGIEIAGLAASGQMHSSVFLDKSGNIIRKAIMWNDTRTTAQVSELNRIIGADKMLEHVQNPALEGFTLPKILWLKDNEPENFAKIAKIIMPKDYVNYRLTGRIATDISDAAGTLLFDVAKGRWSGEMAEMLGLPMDILPEVLQSIAPVGEIAPEIAAELGLPGGIMVFAGGADNSCAAIGMGMTRPGHGIISIGTSGTIMTMLENIDKINSKIHMLNYSIPDKYYAMGCMLCAGESLAWLRDILGIEYAEIDALATSAPDSGGLLFLPYLFGERCPVADPAARGVFFGISRKTTAAHMARAAMEGIAFNYRAILDEIETLAPIKKITITGGGARSPIFAQILADILARPLEIPENEEGPALGAAMIAAVGAGLYPDFATIHAAQPPATTITPNPTANHTPQYTKFRALYTATAPLFNQPISS